MTESAQPKDGNKIAWLRTAIPKRVERGQPGAHQRGASQSARRYTRDEEGFGLRPSIGIRGLDPNRSAKVLLMEDGVPLGMAPYGDIDAYYHPPIERYNGIEVLKGSSQIAYGPNTLGGAVNYLTQPPPNKFSGSVTLLGGNRRYFNGFASAGASFGEGAGKTGMLFNYLRKQGDGARENSGGVIELDPERSWNYEAGFRSTPTRGLKLNATFFQLDYENQIVPANLSGGAGSTLTSAGETLHQGLEFDGRWDSGVTFNSPHNFYVRTAYTYIGTAEYRGTRFSSVSGSGTVSIKGNRLIYSPKHLAAATFGYSHASGFDALIEAIHTGEQFTDDLNSVAVPANGQRGLIPAYTYWNAAVNYRIGKLERYAPTLFVAVKNIADDTFIVDRRRSIMPGIPRLVQGGIKFRF